MSESELSALMEQIETWEDAGEFQKVIDTIEAIPEEERGYDLVFVLANSYCESAPDGEEGVPFLEKSVELLQSIEEKGQYDSGWNLGMGCALYYLDQEEAALHFFQNAAKLNPEDEVALEYIEECKSCIKDKDIAAYMLLNTSEEDSEPEVYDTEEIKAVEEHINKCFGNIERVLHEIKWSDIHVDICVIPPSPKRDFYTLVTMGMGAHRMNVPEDISGQQEIDMEELAYAELMLTLPSKWKLDHESLQDEKWYWPLRLLKSIARMPGNQDTWLGWGHTVASGKGRTFAQNTKLCSVILLMPDPEILTDPEMDEDDADICVLPNGKMVNFYQLIPLYQEELEYKEKNDVDMLLDKLEKLSHVIDIKRPNVARGNKKKR